MHPTKCQGVLTAIQRFVALGTMVCLASQTFSVPEDKVVKIEAAGKDLLACGGEARCRTMARFRGVVGATWLSTCVA